MATDYSTQLPIFWFNILDSAIQDKIENSADIWGGDIQYAALCAADSISVYQVELAVTQYYQRYGADLVDLLNRAGDAFDELEIGAPVLAILTAPTLGSFCDLLCRYSVHIHPLLKIFSRETEKGELELWVVTHEFADEITLAIHLSLGLYLSVILKLIRRYLKAPKLCLPVHINKITIGEEVTAVFEQVFNIELKQGYPARYFLFSKELIDKVHRQTNPELHEQLKILAEKQTTNTLENSIIFKVNDVFKRKQVTDITLEKVALELYMSARTLNRKLQQQGVSFRRLYDKYRLEQSLKMLNQQNASVTHIAHEMGFSDSSAFSRAFKRWTGDSPKKIG
ncbi:helix-turn-helix transcriptional regulator [Vibrio sp. 404]|uniref:Helix-turn-helix transcriptional regulator n=1 Tax=Vibrio marinisediminis TaxID=2758441 RepID=A0A7W2FMZ6_9VIBR|nr:helix-turn-helix transcriptional regulator [Vibrio marinisediminis]MBA5761070.1 helix-turn-helix transcriptional regulator [Vibrio marinisediminis]